jgi:hypothetical protein
LFTVDHKPIPLEPENKTAPPKDEWRVPKRPFTSRRGVRWVGACLLTAAVGVAAWYTAGRPASVPAPAATGKISIDTKPTGISVVIDGQPRGVTPLVASLAPGRHKIEVSAGNEVKEIPITLDAGEQVSQYLEFQAVPDTGRLRVDSDPQGARVAVDGQSRGAAPVVVENLTPGVHSVSLQGELGSVDRQVTIEAGGTNSLVIPLMPRNAPLSGWLAVSAPVELEIYEGGHLLGTTASDRLMVATGRHDIEVANTTLGFRAPRTVNVFAGKTVAVPIEMPQGVLHLNASPWAEVWIDGKKIGETPIGNLAIAIGPHEVIFRNPQFPEQRHALTVTLTAPARLSVTLKR